MARSKTQFQKGLSDVEFQEIYGTEEQCRNAVFRLRWPDGFRCPACGGTRHCRTGPNKRLFQCTDCRRQTSLTAGTIFDNTKLPLTTWFRAMHLVTRGKHGISSLELGRCLGVSQNAAHRILQKLMQVMHERERDGRHRIGGFLSAVQMDDAYLGGEHNGGKRGRGAAGKTPFVAVVETGLDGRPQRTLLQVVSGFKKTEVETMCRNAIEPGTVAVSDGLSCFRGCGSGGLFHIPITTGGGRASTKTATFSWVNTVLANVKNSLLGTHRWFSRKHAPRYLAQFQWRFNRRFNLKEILTRLAYAAVRTPPMPAHLLKMAESRW
ncbi:transposase-like zinc ribbon protein [Azospirillum brasilense]|uniref:Transposase-like zinc ribbon protein n=1 Tax=Azospirillum brasilense TaxID=192 RepID=A0A560BJ25_AZOBR|nr:IS1595 family transposase [Azospirillum brasilense]TWA72628.1 transposase-like zinc ribbon protein [Azospirillum brasilense]